MHPSFPRILGNPGSVLELSAPQLTEEQWPYGGLNAACASSATDLDPVHSAGHSGRSDGRTEFSCLLRGIDNKAIRRWVAGPAAGANLPAEPPDRQFSSSPAPGSDERRRRQSLGEEGPGSRRGGLET